MALVGGGGAGNIAGSNPAGTGTSLNYIGDHCFAYSGAVATSNSTTTVLDFTTGVGYVIGKLQPTYLQAGRGEDFSYKIVLNGERIGQFDLDASNTSTPFEEFDILVPPYSTLEITAENATDSTTVSMGALFTGRVYA